MKKRVAAYEANEDDPYINRDSRCTHSKVEFDPIDYCWGYAIAVDKNAAEKYIRDICPKCGLWKEVE